MPVTRIVGRDDGTGVGDDFPHGFPVVAKPCTGFESCGVTVVEDRAGLARLPIVAELAVIAVLHVVPGRGFAAPRSNHESGGHGGLLVDALAADWRLRDHTCPGRRSGRRAQRLPVASGPSGPAGMAFG